MLSRFVPFLSAFAIAITTQGASGQALSVEAATDAIVTRLYETHAPDRLAALSEPEILRFITPAERNAFATRHVQFNVNVPAVVSVMRHTRQRDLPFWLPDSGFEKTVMTVTNTEGWVYEVWQKNFPPGPVGLGINGFQNHRPHYFVSVGPQDPAAELTLSDLHPAEFPLGWMNKGAYVYNDWTSLLLEDVPEAIDEHTLLTTIRGRARATYFAGGFRETPFPASTQPDQVVLSWTGDPKKTQTVQWRGSTDASSGALRYRIADSDSGYTTIPASHALIEDRFLANDRYCHKYTVTITGLEPGTRYTYQVGFPQSDSWSVPESFATAPAQPAPFTFLAFGDTQSLEPWQPTLEAALKHYPNAAFATIAGDVVDTGQNRDQWDRLFHVAQPLFSRIPLMPALGNHDIIDGLGAAMWRASLALPENGPPHLEPERAYSFEYSNALVIVLDSGLSAIDQAAWLEETLANSNATWKFAVHHFPPYSYDEPYPDIESLWGYLFDKYGLDIAFEGHFHYYMRSHPMYRGRPQAEGQRGTTHVLSIAIPNRERKLPPANYAAKQFTGIPLFEAIEIDGNTLTCKSISPDGQVHDEFILIK